MQGQRLLLLFDACAITCGLRSTVLGVWGDLISFRSVLVFSSAFFRHFVQGTVCLSSFVFPRAFLQHFSRKNWRHFAVALRCCPIRMCWPVRFFSSFSMLVKRPTFYNLSLVLLPTPSMAAPLFSGDSVAVSAVASGPSTSHSNKFAAAVALTFFRQSASLVSSLFYVQRTSPLVLQRGPSPSSSVVFFQRCFPPYFQLRFGSYQLAFLSYRYVEIAAISGLPSPVALTLRQSSFPTFVAAFREENLAARSPAWLFPMFLALLFRRYFQLSLARLGC